MPFYDEICINMLLLKKIKTKTNNIYLEYFAVAQAGLTEKQ
jgi:hypothetical protein